MQSRSIIVCLDEQREIKMIMTSTNVHRETSFAGRAQTGRPTKCRQIRARLYRFVSSSLGLDASWVQNHIADCPRCRRRLAAVGKVEMALSLVKSQRHNLDLLMRANAQAVGVLRHSLRQAPKAEKLKKTLPEPTLPERLSKYKHSAANVAACFAILLLTKIGVFSSMEGLQTHSQEVLKQYYAGHIGQDLADEIFPA